MKLAFLSLLALPIFGGLQTQDVVREDSPAQESDSQGEVIEASYSDLEELQSEVGNLPSAGPLVVERGPEMLPVRLPASEKLEFDVVVDLGVLGKAKAGNVTLRSGTEAFQVGLPMPGMAPSTGGVVGWIESHAKGKHLGYEIDHVLLTKVLPQEWPHIFYRDTQRGSENRRRELKIGRMTPTMRGTIEAASGGEEPPLGHLDSWYRNDGHCKGCERREHYVESRLPWGDDHHCKKCKRAEHREWRDPHLRSTPQGTVDMLSAIFLARSLVADGIEVTTFPMLDKTELWDVTLTRGEEMQVETPAGKFEVTEVVLSTTIPESEDREEEEFSGMFGIHGTIQIWVDSKTGVPVVIGGDLPVGPLDLQVRVRLIGWEGTPETFGPIAPK